MFQAAIRGNIEGVCQLLKSGANPNIRDQGGFTPILYSAIYGKLHCAIHLLQHCADVRAFNHKGWTSLHLFCCYASMHPARSIVLDFLDKLLFMGLDINASIHSGWNSLHLSIQEAFNGGNITLRWLLDHNADYKAKTPGGRSILHLTGDMGTLETVQVLRQARLSQIDVHAVCYESDAATTAMDLMISSSREVRASHELIESFQQLLDEIEARTNGQPILTAPVREGEKEGAASSDTVYPPKSSEPFDQDADLEDEPVFHDSVEYHFPDSQAQLKSCEPPAHVVIEAENKKISLSS